MMTNCSVNLNFYYLEYTQASCFEIFIAFNIIKYVNDNDDDGDDLVISLTASDISAISKIFSLFFSYQ